MVSLQHRGQLRLPRVQQGPGGPDDRLLINTLPPGSARGPPPVPVHQIRIQGGAAVTPPLPAVPILPPDTHFVERDSGEDN